MRFGNAEELAHDQAFHLTVGTVGRLALGEQLGQLVATVPGAQLGQVVPAEATRKRRRRRCELAQFGEHRRTAVDEGSS